MSQKEELRTAIDKAKKAGVDDFIIQHLISKYTDHDDLVKAINIYRFIFDGGVNKAMFMIEDCPMLYLVDDNYNEINNG